MTANFNRFYNNNYFTMFNGLGTANLENNWWGSNNPDFNSLIFVVGGSVSNNTWLKFSLTANPLSISPGQISTITLDFTHNSAGQDVSANLIGFPVTFSLVDGPFGTLNEPTSKNTTNGIASVLFKSLISGIQRISAVVDNQYAEVSVNSQGPHNTADLVITKTFVDALGNLIDNVNYQGTVYVKINVTNNGPNIANGVYITDIFPDELTPIIASSKYSYDNGATWISYLTDFYASINGQYFIWDLIDGRSGSSPKLSINSGQSFIALIPAINTGYGNAIISNTVKIDDWLLEQYDPNKANNVATDSYTATNAVALITMTNEFRYTPDGPAITTANLGDTIYTVITLINHGPDVVSIYLSELTEGIDLNPGGISQGWIHTQGVFNDGVASIYTSWDVIYTTEQILADIEIPLFLSNATFSGYATVIIKGVVTEVGRVNNTANMVWSDPYYSGTLPSATAQLTVPGAHVTLDKTMTGTPEYWQLVTFHITAHNNGPSDAEGVQVKDLLPEGLTYVSSTPSGTTTYDDATGIWDIGTLVLGGADATLDIVANVTGTGTIVNWANVTAQTTPDSRPFNSTNFTFNVEPASIITMTKEFRSTIDGTAITTANYMDTIYAVLNVTNNGPDDATNININDVFSGFNYQGSYWVNYGSGWIFQDTTSPFNGVNWIIPSLSNGKSILLALGGTVDTTGDDSVTNTATQYAQDQDHGDTWPSATASLDVPEAAYVDVSKQFRDSPWGDIITTTLYKDTIYAIVKVENQGPDFTSLTLGDLLTGMNWTGNYYTLSGTINPSDPNNWVLNDLVNVFDGTNWTIPNLSSDLGGNVKQLAIEVIVNQTGILSNYAETTSQSAYPCNGLDSDTAYITANHSPTSLTVDDVTGNKGTTVNLKATLIDTAHANIPISGKTILFKVNGVDAGTAITDVNGVATLPYSINLVGGTYTIGAEFVTDDQYMGSTDTGTLKVPQSSIYVLTTVSNSNPTVGEIITVTFKLGNNGPDAADDVVLTYIIPEGMEFVSLQTQPGYPEGVYNPATRTITWNLGTVPILDPWIKIKLKSLKSGTFIIKPTVTTSTYDPTINESVQSATVNTVIKASAYSDTVRMQNTGMPLNYLAIAVLMVISGLILPKIK
ncbi:hypothetical protein [Methanobacterium alcaliphilum]|uniref:hypothetical protein n=1 Tax=Methanobacterium alcaliphilum TaxID=392018 RepID=UPI002009DD82|nr:hypothetical protein [Methanobacterium alcaliphilum]MCK9150413.1 hypothetical protein [Methanobacterium alcaliphilum]